MHDLSTSWIRRALFVVILACVLFPFQDASAQRIALKTNALEYLILSPNLTMEARLSRKMSLQLGITGNPITRPIADYKMTNFRVEPELRYWFNRPMAKHFVALSTTAGTYSLQLKDHFISGDVFAAGLSYGYALVLGRHWNFEAEIGAGYVHAWYDKFDCDECGRKIASGGTNYVGITKIGLSLLYIF